MSSNEDVYNRVFKITGPYLVGDAILNLTTLMVEKGLLTIEELEEAFPKLEKTNQVEKPLKWYQFWR